MQVRLGDPSGNIYTSANLLNWLNEAQKVFCMEVMPLRQLDATIIGTGFQRFPIPSDKIMIEGVFTRNSIAMKMKALNFTDWNNQVAACPGAVGKDSDCWTEIDQNLYVYPAYGVAPKSTFSPLGATATATTLTVLSTTGFKPWGRLLINQSGEEIEYTGIDSTHFYNCTRGVAGTTASIIFKGGRITQCDLWIVYRRNPVTMATVTATPEIRSVYHEYLQLYAMYLAYKQTGEGEKAKALYDQWEETVKRGWWTAVREHLSAMTIRDTETEIFNHTDGPR